MSDVPDKIDTVTLYLLRSRSGPLMTEIVDLVPRRIIMDAGAENADLANKARARHRSNQKAAHW